MSSIRTNITNTNIIPFPSAKNEEKDITTKISARDEFKPPKNRGYQAIPSIDALQNLINKALEALQNGVYWERGSIINIVT